MATGHDIAMGLRAAYWSMHRRTNAYLASHNATAEQFVLVSLLAERDGTTQQELCRRAASDPNTIRAILVLLEKRGLVTRHPHPTDGRARCVTLTRQGRRAYEKWQARIKPLQDQLLDLFLTRQAKDLVEFLDSISVAMTAARDHDNQDQATASAREAGNRTERSLEGEEQ